jgi:N-acetylglutamate synthase-like GNAT family acetyltransferase
MTKHEYTKAPFIVSTDPARLDVDVIHGFLKRSHWAPRRRRETLEKSIANSLCYGLYEETSATQIGFARVVTDYCTFAYLCDVFLDEAWRGRGLARWLMTCVFAHPELQELRRFMLATKTARGLYEKFGFKTGDATRLMEILKEDPA